MLTVTFVKQTFDFTGVIALLELNRKLVEDVKTVQLINTSSANNVCDFGL